MTDLVDSPARPGGRARALLRTEGPAAARILVTVAAAWQAALWLGADQPPVFAAIVPLVALRGDPMTALGTSLQRILGVVAGVLIAIAVLNLWQPSTLTLTLVVALGLGVGMVLRAAAPSTSRSRCHRCWSSPTPPPIPTHWTACGRPRRARPSPSSSPRCCGRPTPSAS